MRFLERIRRLCSTLVPLYVHLPRFRTRILRFGSRCVPSPDISSAGGLDHRHCTFLPSSPVSVAFTVAFSHFIRFHSLPDHGLDWTDTYLDVASFLHFCSYLFYCGVGRGAVRRWWLDGGDYADHPGVALFGCPALFNFFITRTFLPVPVTRLLLLDYYGGDDRATFTAVFGVGQCWP
jgi:hypothetical protein